MTKTVAAMLAYKKLTEMGIDIETPVVEAFPEGRAPEWVEQWQADERAGITIADLMYMRAGLKIDEGYDPGSDVLDMLYNQPDMAGWAAEHPSEYPPGEYWEYLSAVSNILAEVVEAQFDTPEEYWTYPRTALYDPLGVKTATLETDESGYLGGVLVPLGQSRGLGAVRTDDARPRHLQGEQILPPGWWELAGTSAVAEGEGAGYGAQTWIAGNPVGGSCKATPGVPEDTLYMGGHWGQTVAMVPSATLSSCDWAGRSTARRYSTAVSSSATCWKLCRRSRCRSLRSRPRSSSTKRSRPSGGSGWWSMRSARVRCVCGYRSRGNGNHFGTMYAGALFGLCELPGGLIPLGVLDPTKYTPIVTRVDIRFLAAARTDVTLVATVDAEQMQALGEQVDREGRAEFTLELHGEDADGRTVVSSTAYYQLRPNRG
jgi:CubicO group peptidase (beta-lactamase class C family)